MPSVTRIQYTLPNLSCLDQLLTDDLILRYVKDDYQASRHNTEFYDTADWALTRHGFSLDVIREQALPVVHLARGIVADQSLPGLFHGEEWVAPFTELAQVPAALLDRGAPASFGELIRPEQLEYKFAIQHSSKSTTLYLPDRTRIEMSFDSGVLVVDTQHKPTFELSMNLLFGEEKLLINYCQQLCERFSLPPVELSREQRALMLLRGG